MPIHDASRQSASPGRSSALHEHETTRSDIDVVDEHVEPEQSADAITLAIRDLYRRSAMSVESAEL